MTPDQKALIESCPHPGIPKQWIAKWPSNYYSTPAPMKFGCNNCGAYVLLEPTLVGDDTMVTA